MLVLHVWHLGGITQPEAFCAGTTAAYRKGNGSNSVLTPSITLNPPITTAPVDSRDVHPDSRAGFDECHGSDICSGTNWANVQADAQPAGVFNAIWIPMTMLYLLGIMVLIAKKHTVGLSISWKVFVCIQLLAGILQVNLVPISAVTVPAQGLRATGNEVTLSYITAPLASSPVRL